MDFCIRRVRTLHDLDVGLSRLFVECIFLDNSLELFMNLPNIMAMIVRWIHYLTAQFRGL